MTKYDKLQKSGFGMSIIYTYSAYHMNGNLKQYSWILQEFQPGGSIIFNSGQVFYIEVKSAKF